ncbi:uncharacterized protein LOC129920580 isoform X2 [Episyrphus balteatus]|uniref:uncharacterized protein LOC129920580 isoform X2 n=1 Tax=Episyrphus balteatus TaxID=286459 RepID=UPI002486630D|nr:uncharacterized protein LOC129920580 isoform X2 [Episyrphus balteatus]
MEYARTINGRSDFIGGIDNEALDFGHLEQFIHVAATTGSGGDVSPSTVVDVSSSVVSTISNNTSRNSHNNNNATVHSNLPESPPDSGSEPPFSPADLQGLTLTSRVTSNCQSATNNDGSSSLIDSESSLGQQRQQINVKPPPPDLHATLTHHLTGSIHQQQQQQQHHTQLHQQQHNHNIHQHHLYVEHNDQHALLLTPPTGHLPQQQHIHHNDPATTTTTTPSAVVTANGIYTSNNVHDHSREHPDSLLAINSHHQQPVPLTSSNIHVAGMSEIIDMEPQGTPYSRQMMTPQHQQHAASIIPSDVYMGTPAPIIESTTSTVPPPTRKRKLSQVDCCASMMTIKPEPGATLSPMCQQNLNPTSPVSINMQQVGAGVGLGSGSPSSSSLSPTSTSLSMSNDNNSLDGVGGSGTPNAASFVGSNATDSSSESSPMQCIRFSPFQQHNWHTLCDQSLQELTMAHYRVDADKGFNFSVSDDAFVCQKKNHFQITCHARLQGDAKFVRTPSGLEKIKSFHLHFYGVKLEAPNQTIRVEQSQSDRSKKPFYPVPIDLQSHLVSKVTVGRLHFSETTNNNMRKKGRPNPEQRYFQLIVGLHVHTHSGHFPVVSQGSERIIVRASNPGQFESDVELCWQRGITPESIFHAGRVGINTDRPDESLVIHGNLKVSGHIIQPSDSRAKQEISELDTSVQLRNLQKIRIVRYRYEPEFALHSGLKSAKDNEEIIDTGVIAQEVREVLPDAVTEAGSIVLPSGQVIENFLLVNKDRILMENIGAVKELCKVTGSLETRIEQLEKINNRLMRMQEIERSKKKCKHLLMDDDQMIEGEDELCSNRTIQMMIIILVIIMATCLVAVSTLYFVEHSKQRYMKRYDRYDISHHPFTHDAHAILVNNNNNNNQRNLNHNGYHTNKNGKLILHSHTQRPPPASSVTAMPPITLPLPIHSSQIPPNVPLLAAAATAAQSPSIPISVIPPAPYPSANTAAGSGPSEGGFHGPSYINSDNYANLPNDELLTGIDKLALPVVISSHLNNKTANSKNKSKWPSSSSSADAVATVMPPFTFSNNFNDPSSLLIDDNLNVSESSSEKVGDSIPVNPDFENNSIDGTDQKTDARAAANQNLKLDQAIDQQQHITNNIGGGSTNRSDGRNENSVLLGAVAVSAIGAKKIDSSAGDSSSSSSSSSSTLSSSSSASTIFVVYKNIQNKNINDTVSKQVVNFTVETPSITNKSRGIDTEDTDLQNLGNNNDSTDDQSFTETATAPVTEKKFALAPIGIPDHCVKIKLEEISNCQSACFEDSNSLSSTSSQNSESEIRRRYIQKQDPGDTKTGSGSSPPGDSSKPFPKSSSQSLMNSASPPDALPLISPSKRISTDDIDQDDQDQEVSQQPQNDREDHEEQLALAFKERKPIHKDSKRKIDTIEVQSVVVNEQRRLSSTTECSTVTPWLQADTFNVSLGCEEICLNGGSSLNITYMIPLSKYLKDTNVELHFVAPLSLHWTVCNNKEKTKRDGANFINPLNNGKVFQKSQNVSIFYLTIPGHGHFERLIELRAAIDSNKNLCREQADETNVLLQYNIRIVRDCD